ncbi:MAG: VCBS domain-containing protein, partial [Candidatus Bathyarchaeia archaeon]
VYGTAEFIVSGSAGSGSAGVVNIETGRVYTYTITGSFITIPGYYTVRVVVGLEYDIWEGSASFQILQRTPFDFTLSISPPSRTVKKGGTATYDWAVTYSDPSYAGTRFSWDIEGLDPSMKATATTGKLNIKTSDATPPGTYGFTFTLSARGISRSASATLIVEAPFDYSITVSPADQTVGAGDQATYTVTVSLASGTAQPVSLTMSGHPTGASYTFSPPQGTPAFTSTLTVETAEATPAGSYSLTVKATGGGVTRTAAATLTVVEKDFKITVKPAEQTKRQAETAEFTIEISPVGEFEETVDLEVSGLPEGASSRLSKPSGIPPFTSRLQVDTTLVTPVGEYDLAISAEGGRKAHSETATLKVEKAQIRITISHTVEGRKVKVKGSLAPPAGREVTLKYRGEQEDVAHDVPVEPDGRFSDEVDLKQYGARAFGEWEAQAVLEESGEEVALSNIEHFTIQPPWYYRYISWLPEWLQRLFGI